MTIVPLLLALHILSAIFWAGSTFTLARTGGVGGERLFGAQMGSAVIALVSGGALWGQLHAGRMAAPEFVLAAGIVAAIIAAVVQIALRARPAIAQRLAAGLLAVTAVTMVVAPYAS